MPKQIFKLGLFLLISFRLFSFEFLPCCDPRLNQPSELVPVDQIKSEAIQTLIKQMLKLSGHEANTIQTGKESFLVGLAAPQCGVMKQIIIVDCRSIMEMRTKNSRPKFDILINPKVIWESKERHINYEGCFSVPSKYLGVLERPKALLIKAYGKNGQIFTKRYEGLSAQIVSHEIDHLKGVRFPQKLKSEKELHLCHSEDELSTYRKHWHHWKKCASKEEFNQMKQGIYPKPLQVK